MIDVESRVLIKPSKRNQQFCDKVELPSSYDECRIIMLITYSYLAKILHGGRTSLSEGSRTHLAWRKASRMLR